MSKVQIVVADDHTLMRQGLCRILEQQPEWSVVAQASTGREAVAAILEHEPQVAIIDVSMPLLNGIEATRQVMRRLPRLNILMLSMHLDEAYIVRTLEAGAKGYLLKDSADAELVQAVHSVSLGKSYFSPAVAKIMLDDYLRHLTQKGLSDRYDALSEREREIFQLIAEGHSNKEIAGILSVSPATVETHRAHIFQKLDVHNTAELVLYAVRRGVVS